jgi:hypothetical protein
MSFSLCISLVVWGQVVLQGKSYVMQFSMSVVQLLKLHSKGLKGSLTSSRCAPFSWVHKIALEYFLISIPPFPIFNYFQRFGLEKLSEMPHIRFQGTKLQPTLSLVVPELLIVPYNFSHCPSDAFPAFRSRKSTQGPDLL